MDEEVEGFRVVAQALARLGVKYMFGVVGIPVVEVGAALQGNYSTVVGRVPELIPIVLSDSNSKAMSCCRWRWPPSRRG